MDINYLPLTDMRIARTFCFTNGGQALYLSSPTEVQRITYSQEMCDNLQVRSVVFFFFFRSCLSVIFIHLFAFMSATWDSCTNHVDMFGVCAPLPPPSARHLKEKVTLVMYDLLQLDRVESHKRTYSQVFLFLKSPQQISHQRYGRMALLWCYLQAVWCTTQ